MKNSITETLKELRPKVEKQFPNSFVDYIKEELVIRHRQALSGKQIINLFELMVGRNLELTITPMDHCSVITIKSKY